MQGNSRIHASRVGRLALGLLTGSMTLFKTASIDDTWMHDKSRKIPLLEEIFLL
jgi:hypothetical protein